jgi:hypothetical protein
MDMLTLQVLSPDSKHSYSHKREQVINYLINGRQSYSEDLIFTALDKLDASFGSIRN